MELSCIWGWNPEPELISALTSMFVLAWNHQLTFVAQLRHWIVQQIHLTDWALVSFQWCFWWQKVKYDKILKHILDWFLKHNEGGHISGGLRCSRVPVGISLRFRLWPDDCSQSVQLSDESPNVFCRAVSPGQRQVGGDRPSICNTKWSHLRQTTSSPSDGCWKPGLEKWSLSRLPWWKLFSTWEG